MRASPFISLAVALITGIYWSATGLAQPTPVREMMEESGMVEVLSNLDEVLADGFRQAMPEEEALPEELADALADAATQAFEEGRFLADLEDGLTENLATSEIAAMTAFYRSPLGQRIKVAEVASATKEAQAEIAANAEAFLAELENQPERRAIFERIDKAILASEISATLAQTMMYGMLLGMLEKQGQPIDDEHLDLLEQQIEDAETMIVTQLRQEVRAGFVHTYRDVTIADLQAYADFLESAPARATYAAFYATIDVMFAERWREIGQGLGTAMRQKRT